MADKKLTLAFDGPSSSGKSTLAKDVARKLGYRYVDTGAMYRAVTLFALRNGLIRNQKIDTQTLAEKLGQIQIDFRVEPGTFSSRTLLNGLDVEREIRSAEVADWVSPVAALDFVRTYLVRQQQQMGSKGGVVMDGRDIGSVVLPDADYKFFVTAPDEVRAQRRYLELKEKGYETTREEVLQNLKKRDHIDSTREVTPLVQTPDAILLDNAELDRKEQLNFVLKRIGHANYD